MTFGRGLLLPPEPEREHHGDLEHDQLRGQHADEPKHADQGKYVRRRGSDPRAFALPELRERLRTLAARSEEAHHRAAEVPAIVDTSSGPVPSGARAGAAGFPSPRALIRRGGGGGAPLLGPARPTSRAAGHIVLLDPATARHPLLPLLINARGDGKPAAPARAPDGTGPLEVSTIAGTSGGAMMGLFAARGERPQPLTKLWKDEQGFRTSASDVFPLVGVLRFVGVLATTIVLRLL